MSEGFFDTHNAGEEWATPRYIWEPLSKSLNGFDLDPASGAEPTPIAETRYTKENNGLAQEWFGDVWINPPYGRKENPKWAKKVSTEAKRSKVDSITALIPNATGAKWFQEYYGQGKYFTFISGRVGFIGAKDDKATFDSVLVSFGELNQDYLDALQDLGLVLKNTTPGSKQVTFL